ncbi:glutathione S-transferase family protein [Dongia deserti]|uniref:glutathione S-transferase family protein n=1 Tax=Dongia deserti TaxID=2268030 RepID=UPI0013C3FFF0|nr:glutathione S-transferase family protein [Dongia deserti]
MKIYGDMISPYVRMCFVTAHEAGIGGDVSLVATGVTVATANADLVALSPIGQIPVLVTQADDAVHDSRVIIDYLCDIAGKEDLLARRGLVRTRVLTLQAVGHGIADAAVGYRNEVAQRPPELHWHAWLERMKLRVVTALDTLEGRWQPELAKVTVGSITVAVVLSYLDYRFPDWTWRRSRPQLGRFHEAFSSRDSMQQTALPAA